MLSSVSQYPIFGPEIPCPHCRKPIAALTLTDTYLCQRHGAFEANPETRELTHLQSNRVWREWEGEWYRQHTHPDGIRFEIHEALDRLYTEGFRATQVVVAHRYKSLISAYLERYNRQVMAHQALYSASMSPSNTVPSKNAVAGSEGGPQSDVCPVWRSPRRGRDPACS